MAESLKCAKCGRSFFASHFLDWPQVAKDAFSRGEGCPVCNSEIAMSGLVSGGVEPSIKRGEEDRGSTHRGWSKGFATTRQTARNGWRKKTIRRTRPWTAWQFISWACVGYVFFLLWAHPRFTGFIDEKAEYRFGKILLTLLVALVFWGEIKKGFRTTTEEVIEEREEDVD